MAASLQWVAAQVGTSSVLTCGHTVDQPLALGAEYYCEECMLGFTAQLDQELAAAAEQAAARASRPTRFPLGRLVATPGALAAFAATGETPLAYVQRHAAGDWGSVGADDWAANGQALRDGERLFSAYRLADGTRVWIITEADRTSTCVLLPEEY